jgi:hypothetical protein
MIYDMILTAIGFPPGGSGRQSCTQIENKLLYECTWLRNNIQNNTKTQDTQIESKTYKTRKKIKRIIKNKNN